MNLRPGWRGRISGPIAGRVDRGSGLPGRQAFLDRVEAELRASRRTPEPRGACLVLGLEVATPTADGPATGHGRPDDEVVARLVHLVGATLGERPGCFARLGIAGFGVLLPGADVHEANGTVEHLLDVLDHDAASPPLRVSIGLATFAGTVPGREELLRAAGAAMREARAGGGELGGRVRARALSAGP
jgi:GGDEF domain-containing protein